MRRAMMRLSRAAVTEVAEAFERARKVLYDHVEAAGRDGASADEAAPMIHAYEGIGKALCLLCDPDGACYDCRKCGEWRLSDRKPVCRLCGKTEDRLLDGWHYDCRREEWVYCPACLEKVGTMISLHHKPDGLYREEVTDAT